MKYDQIQANIQTRKAFAELFVAEQGHLFTVYKERWWRVNDGGFWVQYDAREVALEAVRALAWSQVGQVLVRQELATVSGVHPIMSMIKHQLNRREGIPGPTWKP